MADDPKTPKKDASKPSSLGSEPADDARFTYGMGDLVLLNTKPEGEKTAEELEADENVERAKAYEVCDTAIAALGHIGRALDRLDSRMDSMEGSVRTDEYGSFQEADHPRGPDGKFVSYGAQMHLQKSIYAHGMKKVKGANKLTYQKGDVKLVFEPPSAGKKYASAFKVYKGEYDTWGHKEGSGIGSLEKALAEQGVTKDKNGGLQSESVKPVTNDPMVTPASSPMDQMAQSLLAQGWPPGEDKTSAVAGLEKVFKSGGTSVSLFDDGSWFVVHGDDVFESGSGYTDLHSYLATSGTKPETSAAKPTAPVSKPTNPNIKGVTTHLVNKGFKAVVNTYDGVVFQKDNSTIGVNMVTGEWVSSNPGNLTKVGSGMESLEALMAGKMPTPLPWTNTSSATPYSIIGEPEPGTPSGLKPTSSAEISPAHKVLLKKLEKHAPSGTASQISAVKTYSGSSYAGINNSLRHGENVSGYSKTVAELSSWLDQASLPEDVTLFRKVGGEYAKALKSICFKGAEFQDRGFMSTSPNPGVWHGDLKMEILAKKGTKAAAISHHSQHKKEDEVLVQRGYSMKVVDMDFKNNYIKVELLDVVKDE